MPIAAYCWQRGCEKGTLYCASHRKLVSVGVTDAVAMSFGAHTVFMSSWRPVKS